ncbi:MAG: prolyl oligopeptidase family serine peptidase [Pseudomonadota bacterium]
MSQQTNPEHPHLHGPEWGVDRPEHLVIFVHGWGADGHDLITLAPEFSAAGLAGTRFLAPHAPFPCSANPAGREWFPLHHLTKEEIAAGSARVWPVLSNYLDQQSHRYNLALSRIALIGFSQGTMVALALTVQRPLAAILGFSGLLPVLDSQKPVARSPVMLIHGDDDPIVPVRGSIKACQTLQDEGYQVRLIRRPGLGHGIDMEGIRCGADFLRDAMAASC